MAVGVYNGQVQFGSLYNGGFPFNTSRLGAGKFI